MRDLSGLRELIENIARVLWTLRPPQSLLGDLQRSLSSCYRSVGIAEHISGYLNKSFTDDFNNVLDFANSGEREFLNASAARRFRDLRKVNKFLFLLNFLGFLQILFFNN